MVSALLVLIGLLLLTFFGEPLFIVISIIALICFYYAEIDSSAIIIELYRMASAPTLIAIPLFTFAGYMMAESKTPQRLIRISNAFLGWLPGGVSILVLVSCAFFTAFTGASGVTIIAMGGLLYPVLLKAGYNDRFSMGMITSCGSLGLLFPPSIPLILYGLVSKAPVDKLFIAGLIPGLLIICILCIYGIKKGLSLEQSRYRFSMKEVFYAVSQAKWEIPIPFIILGGIYGGLFTPSEAAAIMALYVLVVEVFIYRDISLRKDLPRIIRESMLLVGGILIILGCALGLTNYLIDAEIPMKILDVMKSYITSKYLFLMVLNLFLLIVGCMMDIFSAIIVVVPLIIPFAAEFGVDPIHLGIIFLTNLEIGYSTPPVGINLFIASFRFGEPVVKLYHSVLPFLGIRLTILMVITYIPDLSLRLVKLLT